jgi:putative membrane protein (TIGR04086 family)
MARVERVTETKTTRLDVVSVLSGVLVAFAASLVLAVVLAFAVLWGGLGETATSWSLRVGALLAVACGGAFSAKKAQGRGLLHGVLAGLIYSIACVAIASLVPGIPPLSLFRHLGLGVLAGGIGGVVGVNS